MEFTTEIWLTGTDPASDAATAAAPVRRHEVTHLKMRDEPVDLRAYYDAFVEALGTPVDIAEDYANGGRPTGQRWSDIRYDADIDDMVAFRHSKNAQPLHTDESYVSSPAGVMLFYCVNRAPSGGETVYVSGRRLVDHLRVAEPDLLDELLTVDVCYRKADDFKHRPIVTLTDDGRVDLNFNYFCAEPSQDERALALNERFHRWLEDELPAELTLPIALDRGDAVAWHDDVVLHGRNAFHAVATGDRLIWKTGVVLEPSLVS